MGYDGGVVEGARDLAAVINSYRSRIDCPRGSDVDERAIATAEIPSNKSALASHICSASNNLAVSVDARYIRIEQTRRIELCDLTASSPHKTVRAATGIIIVACNYAALIEQGVLNRVIPASPTTLIALLKAVNYGWNQEKLARNAQQISALGKELHDRLRLLAGHITQVGTGLDRAVESYNKAVGSLESRVLVSARKFAELGTSVADDIPELEPIETTARALSFDWGEEDAAPELSEDERKAG